MSSFNLGNVSFIQGVKFNFPLEICANCATNANVVVKNQDTRVTTFLLLGGSEITFQLPISICKDCEVSLYRRPRPIFSKVVISSLISGGLITIALLVDTIGEQSIPFLSGNLLTSFIIFLSAILAFFVLSSKPKNNQSSYYQPVRITNLSRNFIDGAVKKIVFSFTNEKYFNLFLKSNKESIESGHVGAKKA